jgi:hypothetical protein
METTWSLILASTYNLLYLTVLTQGYKEKLASSKYVVGKVQRICRAIPVAILP